jgi:hypothetical protein
MNINFTIGLGFLEFCCHFVAMLFYIGAGFLPKENEDGVLVSVFLLLLGIIFTTIGANL